MPETESKLLERFSFYCCFAKRVPHDIMCYLNSNVGSPAAAVVEQMKMKVKKYAYIACLYWEKILWFYITTMQ